MGNYSVHRSSSVITVYWDSTTQVNTVCERELSALILVEPVLLFDKPCITYMLVTEFLKQIFKLQLFFQKLMEELRKFSPELDSQKNPINNAIFLYNIMINALLLGISGVFDTQLRIIRLFLFKTHSTIVKLFLHTLICIFRPLFFDATTSNFNSNKKLFYKTYVMLNMHVWDSETKQEYFLPKHLFI